MRSALARAGLGNPALSHIQASWFLFNLAEWAYVTALAIHGYELHGALGVGLIGARFAAGALLGATLLGVVSLGRPEVALRLLALGRFVAVAAAALALAIHAPFGFIVALVWIDAVVAAPYRPVQSSLLPALADTPRELSAAAGSIPTSKALAQALGALAGSLALTIVAPAPVVAVAAAPFLLTSLLVAPIRPDAPLADAMPQADVGLVSRGGFGVVREGFELIAGRARPLLVLGGARSFTRGLWTSLAVVTSIELLRLGNAGVGILMAAAGLGAAAAVPLSLQFAGRPDLARPAALTFALAGIPIALVGAIALPAPAVALIVIWGTALTLADAIANSLLHRVVEAQRLAPSVGAIESSKTLLEGIGALAAPLLVAMLGIRDALIVAGALLPLLVIASRTGLLAVDQRARARHRPLVALRGAPSFRGLTMLALESLASRLHNTTATAGSAVVREGEVGDRFYLIDSGHVEVTLDGFLLSVLGPGGSFGEKALLRAAPRSATVTALEPTRFWYLDAPDFVAAATGNEGPSAQRVRRSTRYSLEEMLDAVPLFAGIDRRGLAAIGRVISAPDGEEIVREGDPGDLFYVIVDGELRVTVGLKPARTLERGDWFGEIALLHNVPRKATITAVGPVRLWTLGREQFLVVLGEAAAVRAVPPPPMDTEPALAGAGLLV